MLCPQLLGALAMNTNKKNAIYFEEAPHMTSLLKVDLLEVFNLKNNLS